MLWSFVFQGRHECCHLELGIVVIMYMRSLQNCAPNIPPSKVGRAHEGQRCHKLKRYMSTDLRSHTHIKIVCVCLSLFPSIAR